MRLAVSNIAWDQSEDDAVAEVLARHGVRSVELAPPKVFVDPLAATAAEVDAVVDRWAARGMTVAAFQSMLFGRPELLLFGPIEVREATIATLTGFVRLAARMGAGRLVFGSPGNRRVPGGMSADAARSIAVDAFRRIGDVAEAEGVCFCIEPNPTVYGCDFVTTAAQGRELVESVASAGFGLHLDAAGMTLAGDDLAAEVRRSSAVLRHVHASAPQLGPLEEAVVRHGDIADALRDVRYDGLVSVEMRAGDVGDGAERIDRALRIARRHYGAEPVGARTSAIGAAA